MISYNKLSDLLLEDDQSFNKLSNVDEQPSLINKFTTRPQGFLIYDTYNNPFFPISDIIIDTAKPDIIKIFKIFRSEYSSFKASMLPWHFMIDFIQNEYFIFNTRPLDMKYPINNIKFIEDYDTNKLDDIGKKFFKDVPFDISEAIHIVLIGDSNKDVYTKKLYEKIGRFCIVPFIRYFHLTQGKYQTIFPINLSTRFNLDYVIKFVRL